jgi:hypothetical protein
MPVIPYFYWHTQIGEKRKVTDRCPCATVEYCPRFCQSLSLLSEAGSTKVPRGENDRNLSCWNTGDLWPKTDEDATLISGTSGEPLILSNFCPEVSFDCFGYFAANLSRYADEIDPKASLSGPPKGCALKTDWRWRWATLESQHHRACPVYSILFHSKTDGSQFSLQRRSPWWKKHFTNIMVGLIVIAIGSLLRFLLI